MLKIARKNKARGFTLIELAIVMSIAGLLFVGLWRLLAGGNQQMRDQSAAAEQQQLITAVSTFLASPQGQTNFLAPIAANGTANLALPGAGTACNAAGTLAQQFTCFLPTGFNINTVNSYGQSYNIRVLKDNTTNTPPTPPNTYSFMIVTSGGDIIPDTSGGRISAAIGNDGGFIYSNLVCGAVASKAACGSYGTWSIPDITAAGPASYGFPGALANGGEVASRTYSSPTANNSPWLAKQRLDPAGPTAYWNTMQTDAFLGGNTLWLGSNNTLTTGGSTGANGAINMQGGALDMAAGTINLQGGTISGTGTSNINMVNPNATPAVNPQINISSGCNQTSPGTPIACPYSLQVTQGDINVGGLVNANALYSSTFIYGTVVPPSDIRLKKDVHPLNDPLADIMQMKPVAFTYKSNGIKSFGVIAQDMEKIYPQLVHETNGMKGVEYTGLIAPLIGAVQELKEENDQLRQQLRAQKERQKVLEKEIKARRQE